jgi:hypothetical protein
MLPLLLEAEAGVPGDGSLGVTGAEDRDELLDDREGQGSLWT